MYLAYKNNFSSESAAKNLYHPMEDLHNQVGNTSRGWVLRVPLRSGNFFSKDSNLRKGFIDFLPSPKLTVRPSKISSFLKRTIKMLEKIHVDFLSSLRSCLDLFW